MFKGDIIVATIYYLSKLVILILVDIFPIFLFYAMILFSKVSYYFPYFYAMIDIICYLTI